MCSLRDLAGGNAFFVFIAGMPCLPYGLFCRVLHSVFSPRLSARRPRPFLELAPAWAPLSRPVLCSDRYRCPLLNPFHCPLACSPGRFCRGLPAPLAVPLTTGNSMFTAFKSDEFCNQPHGFCVYPVEKKTWRPKDLASKEKYTCEESLQSS